MSSDLIAAACAPSNIALIKYMGKKDHARNLPENGSLSMTLNHLCTLVEIRRGSHGAGIRWVPETPRSVGAAELRGRDFIVPELNQKGVDRLIRHADRVKAAAAGIFGTAGIVVAQSAVEGLDSWEFRTANTFPQASGIASSASSFAAITLAVARACAADSAVFDRAYEGNLDFRRALARLSRQGSGSSCRSFEGPFVHWEDEAVQAIETKMPRMAHFVLIVSDAQKKVSSSEAHAMVMSSPLWNGRVQRVEERLRQIIPALAAGDLKTVAKITWSESWEMHSLFHTAAEPFSYWEAGSMQALQALAPTLKEERPPIITMDAGPNVHILVEAARRDFWRNRLLEMFDGMRFLEDGQGSGAFVVQGSSSS